MANYKYVYSVELGASAHTAWRVYCDPASWPQWNASVEHIALDGDFLEGVSGELKLNGRHALTFKITAVEPEHTFTNEAATPGGLIRFGYTIDELRDGVICLTHIVEIDAPTEQAARIGRALTADIPTAMASLACYIEHEETGG